MKPLRHNNLKDLGRTLKGIFNKLEFVGVFEDEFCTSA